MPHAVRYELAVWWDAGTALGGDNLTGTAYMHTEVTAGTTCSYSIRALNAAGEVSGWLLDYPTATPPAATSTPTVATTERGALIALYEAFDDPVGVAIRLGDFPFVASISVLIFYIRVTLLKG